jgi:hypothetical protein
VPRPRPDRCILLAWQTTAGFPASICIACRVIERPKTGASKSRGEAFANTSELWFAHSEAVGCMLPVGRKMKTEIPLDLGICNWEEER